MTFHSILETKSATELSADDSAVEVKTALDALTADVKKATAPVADIAKRLDAVEAKLARPNINTKTADADDAKALEAKALNSFLRGGAGSLNDDERKSLSIGSPSTGGYVTAPVFSTTVVEKLTQITPMRSVASVMQVASGKVYIPVNTAPLAGGWVSETGARQSSEPVFDQVAIDAYEHAVIVPVSQQLLEDSFIDLQAFVAQQAAKQFAKAEGTAFIIGDGNGKPTGLLKTPGSYDFVDAQDDGSDLIESVIKAFYQLPGAYAANGSWLMNRATQGAIRAAADTTTKGTLWSDSLADGTPARLLGRPVYDAPDMEDIKDTGSPPASATYPIAFGDFASAYQVVDRVGVQVLRDDFTGADNGIVKFRVRRRVGGKPLLTEAVVLVKAS